jgi:hypothetical protein
LGPSNDLLYDGGLTPIYTGDAGGSQHRGEPIAYVISSA